MATMQVPLSARELGPLRAAGSAVGGVTPRTKNPLLQRDEVGRARPSCYDLPEDEFPYGRPGNQDLEGAREVSMRWVSHNPSRGPQDAAPDFVYYNKKAAGEKIINAKDLKHFRREHDLLGGSGTPRGDQSARSRYGSPGKGYRDTIPSDVVPGFTYGRKVRPSTPIHEVISYRFADQAEQELGRFYSDFNEVQEQMRTQVRKIPLTTASRGHASAAKKAALLKEENKELFKIQKFSRASAKVDTRHRKVYDNFDTVTDGVSDVEPPISGRRGLIADHVSTVTSKVSRGGVSAGATS